MPKHYAMSPCSSCRSVRDACATCGPNRDEADDVIASKTRSGNRRQSGRLVYLKKREEEESKKCQDITHELKVRLETMKEGEEPRPSTSGAPPVSRSNSCPVNKGRRHHNTRQHNSTKKNNRGVNDTWSAGQGGDDETSSADRELSQSGRSRSNSSSSSSNQPSFSPRVTRATSERDGNRQRVYYNTRYQENKRDFAVPVSRTSSTPVSNDSRRQAAQPAPISRSNSSEYGGSSGSSRRRNSHNHHQNQQQSRGMNRSRGGGGGRGGGVGVGGSQGDGGRCKRSNHANPRDEEWAFPSEGTGRREYRGSKRYRQDEKKYEVRCKQVRVPLSVEMPARLEILLDMPQPPYEVQSEHAWNPDDRSLNIFIKEKDEFTFHRYPVAQSTDGIRSKVGYVTGIHLFEIHWPHRQRGTNAVIGVSTQDAPLHHTGYQNLVGSNESSWGWDLSRKKAYHNRHGSSYPAGLRPNEAFHVPDKFYAVLNMDEGWLGYVVDGKFLGPAFQGLKGKKLHLIISAVWGNCEITMRYRGGLEPEPLPLMHLCRHVIRKHMTHQKMLEGRTDELHLPKSVKEFLNYGKPTAAKDE